MVFVTEPAVQSRPCSLPFHSQHCRLPSVTSLFWEQAIFSGTVSMETCNYPRHQQFMLNNFISDQMGTIAATPPPILLFYLFHLVLYSYAMCFNEMCVCGSKYSIEVALGWASVREVSVKNSLSTFFLLRLENTVISLSSRLWSTQQWQYYWLNYSEDLFAFSLKKERKKMKIRV